MGTGDPAREGPMSGISRQHPRPPAKGLLRGAEPYPEEVEEREQWPLSGVRATYKSEYGPSPSTSPHQICLLLEVPGAELLTLVYIRTEAKDHIEGIHHFEEGHGTSFYECLRQYGMEWFGSRAFFEGRRQASQAIWMDLALARRSGQELRNSYVITKSPEHAPLRRFFKAAVDQLQMQFDTSVVTSVQPQSLIAQMRAAVADCDDVSSDGSLMLLSPPRDIPEAEQPAGSVMEIGTRDVESPVVMSRRVTPANRPLQHLEAGHLGASTPQHVMSRPAVPDLCIASTNLLSLIDPLPMDRLSRHTVAAVCSWPAVDRHHILAVANRDVRVARQNLAELQLYVDDHAAHLANCASADDDEIALMSAELLPRLEGGIRAALDEVDTL